MEKLTIAYTRGNNENALNILPITVGSDIYFIPSKNNCKLNALANHAELNKVCHQKVANITFTENGWHFVCGLNMEYGIGFVFVDKAYGKTWFLTEKEAEQALKQMGE